MLLPTIAASGRASALSARAGVGLKLDHAAEVLDGSHGVGFFEIHAETIWAPAASRIAS
jgi:hypothetical protein